MVSLLEAKGVPAMVSRTLIRPPQSRMGPLSPEERAAALKASPLAGRYDAAVDRESAHEILSSRADAKAREAEMAEKMLGEAQGRGAAGQGRRYEPQRHTPARAEPGIAETITKTVVRQLGTLQGQALVRNILGGLFRGR